MMGSYLGWSWLATWLRKTPPAKQAALQGRARAPKTATRWSRLRSDSRPAEAIPSTFPKTTPLGSRVAHEAADRRAAGGKGRLAAAAAGAVEVLAA